MNSPQNKKFQLGVPRFDFGSQACSIPWMPLTAHLVLECEGQQMQVPLSIETALGLLNAGTTVGHIADVMAQAKSPRMLVKEARLAKGLCIRPGCPKRHIPGKKLCKPHLTQMMKGR